MANGCVRTMSITASTLDGVDLEIRGRLFESIFKKKREEMGTATKVWSIPSSDCSSRVSLLTCDSPVQFTSDPRDTF